MDSPEDLMLHHALFRGYHDGDSALRQDARERLELVNETVAAMMDTSKSERRAVGFLFFLFFFVFVFSFFVLFVLFCFGS